MKLAIPVGCLLAGIALGALLGYWAADTESSPATVADSEPVKRGDLPACGPPMHSQPPIAGAGQVQPQPRAREVEKGVIVGRITTRDGRPLAGVTVRASPVLGNAPPARGETLDAEVEAFRARRERERGHERETSTGADGTYRLEGLDEKAFFKIVPSFDSYEFDYAGNWRVKQHRAGNAVDFVGRLALRVFVDIQFVDGRTADYATITFCEDVDRPPSTGYWYWGPDEASRSFEPGDWRLSVRAGKSEEFTAEPVSVRVVAGQPAPRVSIVLADKPCVVGRVVPYAGLGEADLQVRLMDATGKPVSTGEGRAGIIHLWSMHGWEFKFLDLASGNYRLDVLHGQAVVTSLEVNVGTGVTRLEVELPEPAAADFIIVKVRGPDGPVTDGLDFGLTTQDGKINRSTGAKPLNCGEGEYWIRRDEAAFGNSEGGSYLVRVMSRKYGALESPYARTDTHTIEFSYVEPTYVTATFKGLADFEHPKDLRLMLLRPGESPRASPDNTRGARSESETELQIRFGPLAPGDFDVALILNQEFPDDPIVLQRVSVAVVAGENTVEVTMPDLYSVTLVIPEAYRHH
jgi:hypothetical protein